MTEQERFDRCLGVVLRLEGGFADDPRDPGGATNLGVTAATLSQALGRPASVDEVRALTPETVRPIYQALYWTKVGCEELPSGLDLMVFDTAVNMGPPVAADLLQATVGVTVDGIVGAQTIAAAGRQDTAGLIQTMSLMRGDRYRRLVHFDAFGTGWLKRLATVEGLALHWTPSENLAATGETT